MSAANDRFPNPRRHPWPWLTALVLLLGAAGAAVVVMTSGSPAGTPAPAAPLAEFAPVRAVGNTVVIASEGFVRAPEEIDLVSEVEGRVVSTADGFETGARFPAGALLVKIDPTLYAASLQQAEADLASARSALARANNQVERITALPAEDFGAESRLEQVRVERDATAAQVLQAQATVERARIRLDDTDIRAPFDLRVIEESVALGRYVRPGEPLARLAALGAAEIEIGLSPSQAALLSAQAGDPAGLTARAQARGLTLPGRVDRVEPRIDAAARTLDLVVRVDDAFSPAEGMSRLRLDELVAVQVDIPADAGWWRVPTTALKSPGRLWRLEGDRRLQPVTVEVVLAEETHAIVRGPLSTDDRVLLTDLAAPAPGLEVRTLASQEGDAAPDDPAGQEP